jgi:hypothetical protein
MTNEGIVSLSIPADWKTYSNNDYGFSFQYPNRWLARQTVTPRTATKERKATSYAEGVTIENKDGQKIFVTYQEGGYLISTKGTKPKDLEDYLRNAPNYVDNVFYKNIKPFFFEDGRKALITEEHTDYSGEGLLQGIGNRNNGSEGVYSKVWIENKGHLYDLRYDAEDKDVRGK